MKKTHFDVLVVYSGSIANSASEYSNPKNPVLPFSSPREDYNDVYGYFLEICERFNLKAAFATSADIIGAGTCRSYWEFKENTWIKVKRPCYAELIFDKFAPVNEDIKSQRELLFSSPKVQPFNNPSLFALFFDKQKTYNQLGKLAIPTVLITNKTKLGMRLATQELDSIMSKHLYSEDFGPEVIMKDRFGAGGLAVFKFKSGKLNEMWKVVQQHPGISFILQPFVKFDKGFTYKNHSESTDIRLIYLDGKIVQVYIRVAKPGDFRCNEHQGGTLTYLTKKEIPNKILKHSDMISKQLKKTDSLYALDFIITNNGNTYLLEGNTGPGLDWNTAVKENEIKSKELIRNIIEELSVRVNESKVTAIKKHRDEVYLDRKVGDFGPQSGVLKTNFLI